MPATTIKSWKQNHTVRYEEIRTELMPRIHAQMAPESEDIAARITDLERRVIDQMDGQLDDLKPAEAAGALRNLTTPRGISPDKALVMRGQPRAIVKHDVSADIRALVAAGIAQVEPGDPVYIDARVED